MGVAAEAMPVFRPRQVPWSQAARPARDAGTGKVDMLGH